MHAISTGVNLCNVLVLLLYVCFSVVFILIISIYILIPLQLYMYRHISLKNFIRLMLVKNEIKYS